MDPIINFLQSGLDGAAARQKALSDNIANVNTPGYKRKEVNFKNKLKSAIAEHDQQLKLSSSDEKHISQQNATKASFETVRENNNFTYRNDGNNVDIDVEMAEMAKNNLYYNLLVNRINSKFTSLNNVIERGSR